MACPVYLQGSQENTQSMLLKLWVPGEEAGHRREQSTTLEAACALFAQLWSKASAVHPHWTGQHHLRAALYSQGYLIWVSWCLMASIGMDSVSSGWLLGTHAIYSPRHSGHMPVAQCSWHPTNMASFLLKLKGEKLKKIGPNLSVEHINYVHLGPNAFAK